VKPKKCVSLSYVSDLKEIVRMNQELPNNEHVTLRETTTMIEKKHLLTNDKTLIVSSGGSKNKVFKLRDLNETKFVYSATSTFRIPQMTNQQINSISLQFDLRG
jgi:hypothetical protein